MRTPSRIALSVLLVLTLTGCDLAGDLIEFGLWTILILLLIVAAVVYVLIKTFFD